MTGAEVGLSAAALAYTAVKGGNPLLGDAGINPRAKVDILASGFVHENVNWHKYTERNIFGCTKSMETRSDNGGPLLYGHFSAKGSFHTEKPQKDRKCLKGLKDRFSRSKSSAKIPPNEAVGGRPEQFGQGLYGYSGTRNGIGMIEYTLQHLLEDAAARESGQPSVSENRRPSRFVDV